MSFDEDFLWGAATAAHQVEGNQKNNWSEWEPSVADELAKTAENRLKNQVPDWDLIKKEATNPENYISGKAADHYNRYEEDFDLMKQLGLSAYRFSIEWSRIEPQPGVYDDSAILHYKKMLKALHERGIRPFICLHHFTEPIWVEEMGGWTNKDVVDHYVHYTSKIIESLGDYCDYWLTFNEANAYLLSRYLGGGIWADWPHAEVNILNLYKALRNMSEAHRRSYMKIKKYDDKNQVSHDHGIVIFDSGRKDPLTLLFTKITDYMSDLFPRMAKDYQDYLAIHYYVKVNMKVKFSAPQKWAEHVNEPKTDFGWSVYPKGIYEITQSLKKENLPIYITENGLADAKDKLRSDFIKEHLRWLEKSIEDGAEIRGYFHWSLLDNFEWSEGYWPKFGLIEVGKEAQERIVRPSAFSYAETIKKYSAE